MEIITKKEVTTEHLVSLFVSVIESNASTYWADGGVNVDDYTDSQWSNDDVSWWFNPEFFKQFLTNDFWKITIEIDDKVHTITYHDIQKGLQLCAERYPRTFSEFAKNEGFDIAIADIVFQCIVLHEEIIAQNTTGYFSKHPSKNGWEVIYG